MGRRHHKPPRPQPKHQRNLFLHGLPDAGAVSHCYGKIILNKQQAIQAVARMRKESTDPETTQWLTYYKCRLCRHYHVGNIHKRRTP